MASLNFTEGRDGPPSSINNFKQLLPNIVDGLAATRPDGVYAEIPRSFVSYEEGYRKVTYRQLANAINTIAWLITKELGPSKRCEPLAYIGPNDIGYVVLILGASKAGYTILSPSPRLNAADLSSLMKAVECDKVLTLAPPYVSAVQGLLDSSAVESRKPRVIHVPTLYELLDATAAAHFAYPHTFDQIRDQPLVVVHSSGTTGAPKPIAYTHAAGSAFLRNVYEPPPEGFYRAVSIFESNRVLSALPFFHCAALCLALFHAIWSQTTLLTVLAGVPLTTEGFIEAIRQVEVDAVCLATPFVEQTVKRKEWFDLVTQRVKRLAFASANLSDFAARALDDAGVCVCNCYGLSESMMLPPILPLSGKTPEDSLYLELHPCNGPTFKPHGSLFEMVLVKSPERPQPVFEMKPHLTEFHSNDLFSPHPTNPKLWHFEGRADDMIAAATGELCNPIAFEKELSSLPEIAEVMMIGAGRWQKALLIEPADANMSSAQRKELVGKIWAAIEKANNKLSKTSRVARSHVLITSPDMPMQRTGKGSVQRSLTAKLYQKQFDELYLEHGDGMDMQEAPAPIHSVARPSVAVTAD